MGSNRSAKTRQLDRSKWPGRPAAVAVAQIHLGTGCAWCVAQLVNLRIRLERKRLACIFKRRIHASGTLALQFKVDHSATWAEVTSQSIKSRRMKTLLPWPSVSSLAEWIP